MIAKELGQVILTILEHHRQVVPNDDVRSSGAGFGDEVPERRVQLGRSSGYVKSRDVRSTQSPDYVLRSFSRHNLGARRASIDVTMLARLVAQLANVNLQGPYDVSAQVDAELSQLLIKVTRRARHSRLCLKDWKTNRHYIETLSTELRACTPCISAAPPLMADAM